MRQLRSFSQIAERTGKAKTNIGWMSMAEGIDDHAHNRVGENCSPILADA